MVLKTLDDSFQDSIEDVNADFAVHGLGRRRRLEKEGEELRPTVDRHLDARDSSNNTGRGVSNESTERKKREGKKEGGNRLAGRIRDRG
jgi:hypothetical protein